MANGVILGQTPNTNNLLPLDGSRAMTGALNMDSHKITNLSNGTSNNDAVNYYQLMNSTVSASRISGTLSASNIPNLSASKITSGTFSTSRIPDLDASQITSGQFNTARIPNLSASKITSGVLSVANGGTGVSSLSSLFGNLIQKQTFNFNITHGTHDIIPKNTSIIIPFMCKVHININRSSSLDVELVGQTGNTKSPDLNLISGKVNDAIFDFYLQCSARLGDYDNPRLLYPNGLILSNYYVTDLDNYAVVSYFTTSSSSNTITLTDDIQLYSTSTVSGYITFYSFV